MSVFRFSVALAYYGISLSVQTLSGNLYLNNTLMGFVEAPGLILSYLAVKYMSRPLSHGGFMLLSGIFIMVAALVSQSKLCAICWQKGIILTVFFTFSKWANSNLDWPHRQITQCWMFLRCIHSHR